MALHQHQHVAVTAESLRLHCGWHMQVLAIEECVLYSAVQCMLDAEQLGPEQLGYDRPSSKLLAFLRKHYGLASYVPQPNNVSSVTAWLDILT